MHFSATRIYPLSTDQNGLISALASPKFVDADGAATRPVGLYGYPDAVALMPILAVDYTSLDTPPDSGRVHAFSTDHRGAVERVEDMSGVVVWEAAVGPYGEAVVSIGATTSDAPFHEPFRLVGQYFDEETKLCAHRYRSYSPELGRFLESDPVGLQGGMTLYAWPGCPLNTSDPLGFGCGDDVDETPPA
ncbi:MAG: RHS repeat-associated protein [Myxococcota bacterium]|jgi:RHS repeat-associated protein